MLNIKFGSQTLISSQIRKVLPTIGIISRFILITNSYETNNLRSSFHFRGGCL
jgi:hypothetical protein